MQIGSRKLMNLSFTGLSVISIILLAVSLLILLTPIFVRGFGAFYFQGTVEWRKMMLEKFDRGNSERIYAEHQKALQSRMAVYEMIDEFEMTINDQPVMDGLSFTEKLKKKKELEEELFFVKQGIKELLGPIPNVDNPILIREQYGQTRWDRAQVKLDHVLNRIVWVDDGSDRMRKKTKVPRAGDFEGTTLHPLFSYVESNLEQMLIPKRTFYWRFLFDNSIDAHFFGGLWPEMLGTIYLTIGAMLFAVPIGIISAIYLVEYAGDLLVVRALRTFVSTLAGVPSIVFGLFGLAFFINTIQVSPTKSVLAGSLTLALLILPVVIRASEEAIRAVPSTYKEAALSLGAGGWSTVTRVILPAALPGILTGIILSMGRAAGETAPIIFTAAVSVGRPLSLSQTLTEPTPALPWNIYNLATEHEAVDEIRHVQYGMVLTLVLVVLLLNTTAIILRAHVSKKLKV